jgi:hypothetical protein
MVRTWVRNARSKNHGLIFWRYWMVLALMVRYRITRRTAREKPMEIYNHFFCERSMDLSPAGTTCLYYLKRL